MAKRSKKAPKKREQPWMAAARGKLHEKGRRHEEEQITEAFLNLVLPELHALDERAGSDAATRTIDRVKLAWNLPVLHALDTRPGSEGAALRAEAASLLVELPAHRAKLVPLLRTRCATYRHLTRPILRAFAAARGDDLEIVVQTSDEKASAADLLDPSDTGWPKASHALLALSRPARALLPAPDDELAAKRAMVMALIAWNLPILSGPGAVVPAELRERTLAGADEARRAPDEVRDAFEAMVEARRTRFAHDPRVIAGVAARVQGGMLHVDTGAVYLE